MEMRLGLAGAATLVMATALAFGATDPSIGTWKLNLKRSGQEEGTNPRQVIRIYTQRGEGIEVSESWVDKNGKVTSLHYLANYDGKEYPIDTRPGGTVLLHRVDDHHVEGQSKTNGKLDYSFRRIVSVDGKMLTIEITRTDSDGHPKTTTLVYDRQ